MTSTEYGTVVLSDDGKVRIMADNVQLDDWASRPGETWPCSQLARLDEILAVFAPNGDLVDMEGDYQGSADEFNAWSSDVLRLAGLNHPAIKS